MTTKYHPESANDRRMLTAAILAMLDTAGFAEETIKGTKERVFTRTAAGGAEGRIKVAVYTTIVGRSVRATGKDAIRVVALYATKDGKHRGIAKADKRVNRTGTIEGICERTLNRMRDVYKLAGTNERCNCCGAPKFTSKAGNSVCSDLCWLKDSKRTTRAPRKAADSDGRGGYSNKGYTGYAAGYGMSNGYTGYANGGFDSL